MEALTEGAGAKSKNGLGLYTHNLGDMPTGKLDEVVVYDGLKGQLVISMDGVYVKPRVKEKTEIGGRIVEVERLVEDKIYVKPEQFGTEFHLLPLTDVDKKKLKDYFGSMAEYVTVPYNIFENILLNPLFYLRTGFVLDGATISSVFKLLIKYMRFGSKYVKFRSIFKLMQQNNIVRKVGDEPEALEVLERSKFLRIMEDYCLEAMSMASRKTTKTTQKKCVPITTTN